jgi:succinate dehydrogenase hydrophobic anchor subunit
MEETFLVLAVGHALVGMRGILLDLNPSNRVMQWVDPVLVAVGLFSVFYGIWLVQTIIHHGAGG